jgi:hydrogenase nickel incorporation protein HypA/HybF
MKSRLDRPGWIDVMHEVSIMQSALDQALKQAREAGAVRLHEIRLRVGALSGVVPEALQTAFEALRLGTPAENAVLKIEGVPARFWCVVCDREFESEKVFAECPTCRCVSGEVRAGRDLELISMEVD